MVEAFALVLGAVVGSFLNVCIDRLPRGGSLIEPASQCDSCGRRLAPLELIPILSYLFLGGRCRTCRASIPARVPIVEAATAALYLLLVLRFGLSLAAGLGAVFVSVLVVVAGIDLEHHRILNRLTYPAIALALVAAFLPGRPTLSLLLGGGIGAGVLLLLALASPRAMGYGDVKLALFVGLILGYPLILVSLFVSFVVGGLLSALLLAARRLRLGQAVAFGPYLALGGTVTYLYGAGLLMWWLARL
jgi:leader peptidase (prepilin peptidase)/N-methyltransferase